MADAAPPGEPGAGSTPEPTNEQIRDRIDVLTRQVGPGDPGAQAELDQLWLMLRSRDRGPETDEIG